MINQDLNIVLREATAVDEPFLLEVYASTRDEELSGVGWDENQKQAFIKMQFLTRQRSYPRVDDRIIVVDGYDVGRILVDRNEVEMLLVDIALLTDYRNKGIGNYLIQELTNEATMEGKQLRLHVLLASAAVRLYERLGFRKTGADSVYLEMTWTPPTPSGN